MTLNVADVSRYQAGISFFKVKAAGCDAVIVGATYGTAGINPAAFQQLDGVKAAGMLRGVYHIRARQTTTAIEEANYFLSHVRGYLDGSTLPVLDWEECDTSDETWALAWLNEVYRQTGIKPWFYVNLADLQKYRYPRIAAAGYAIWLAYYPYNTVDGFQGINWTPQTIPAGHTLAAWQYVGTGGSLAGIQGLDLSAAYMTAAGWNAYARPTITTDASNVTLITGGNILTDTPIPTSNLLQIVAALKSKDFATFLQTTLMNATAPTVDGTYWTLSSHLQGTAQRTTAAVANTAAIQSALTEITKTINTSPAGTVSLTDAQIAALAAQLGPETVKALAAQLSK